ncbi:MAG: NAD(P)/FAD-dependent oxidoreductase [Lachnospiraceae bacterium]|nr:NAD(P)/FAD-dependent oxidoreductase [Lachnospiraceae bacterium]
MRIIVIGGGAAGMMAAVAAAEAGAGVALLEKNDRLGKKVYITGKGRCNVTNACEKEEFFAHIIRNPRFLYSAFDRFPNGDMMSFVEAHGTKLKTERGQRVFPASDHASDIIKALKKALDEAGVKVIFSAQAEKLQIRNGAVTGVVCTFADEEGKPKRKTLQADRVIVATGGLSYPGTGSTGDGYRFAEEAGHRVTDRMPSLVPLSARFEKPLSDRFSPKSLMGLSLKNVGILVEQGSKKITEDFGEMLFTHFGLSGPVILSASALLGTALEEENVKKKGPVRLHLDLKPALSEEQLDARFLREAAENKGKQLDTYLAGWMPKALIPVILGQAGVAPAQKVQTVSKAQRTDLIRAVKDLPVVITGLRGFDEAVVTRGGVDVKEIDPKTMASKKVSGLYFAGEVLDLDGTTGGFNLQIAWSTGYAAGKGATDNKED